MLAWLLAGAKADALAELKKASALAAPVDPPLVPGTAEYARHLPVADIHKDDLNTKDDWVPR